MTGREALLRAFDRLFDAAAKKLNVVCTPEERAEAKEQFASRFEHALALAQKVEIGELPDGVLDAMEAAMAQQTQEMLRAITFRQAEQRLLEHFALQADERYGGN